ncbi:protein FAR1-RELATED SEQUENCE 5-like [Chenopodium quinoa]|uniref:protein FAR1-RELATED SEQUENCE 5-like n=1 Tax=Chenopodium quinoa TaxID=63459 RepID=UPI000B790E9B|nr:protein FAR1-RELATED SEQUENCE 5-like [Chenopodium quinoa]
MKFNCLQDGIDFYYKYASECGFNVRHSTSKVEKKLPGPNGKKGLALIKYLVCKKEGFVNDNKKDKKDVEGAVFRKKIVRRIVCPAMIKFKYCDGGKYVVYFFHESHRHPFSTPTTRQVTKPYDNGLTCIHRKFIFDNSKFNIRAVMSYRMMKEYCGGYKHVRGTKNQFKNFSRDLRVNISKADGAMCIENLQQKVKNSNGGYYLDYCVDATRHLTRVFWADPIGRKDFHLFRDSISFDTIYDTNKYSLVFCPFTGVDHYKRCVTFCAALLSKEDVESFVWLFQTFLKCMKNEPSCFITDQEPVMELCAVVWDREIEPNEFVDGWNTVMEKYDLVAHECLAKGSEDDLSDFVKYLSSFEEELMKKNGGESISFKEGKEADIQLFVGSNVVYVDILPPNQCLNKGSARSSKRLKSSKEVAVEEKSKKGRTCRAYGQ